MQAGTLCGLSWSASSTVRSRRGKQQSGGQSGARSPGQWHKRGCGEANLTSSFFPIQGIYCRIIGNFFTTCLPM